MIYTIKANAYAIYDACDWPTNVNNFIVKNILNIYYHDHMFSLLFCNKNHYSSSYIKCILIMYIAFNPCAVQYCIQSLSTCFLSIRTGFVFLFGAD